MRLDFAEFVQSRFRTSDHFLCGDTDNYNFRYKQHLELGHYWGDQSCHHTGDIHVHIGERFDEHEPDGDDHLHVDCNQCRRLDHIQTNRYRKRSH